MMDKTHNKQEVLKMLARRRGAFPETLRPFEEIQREMDRLFNDAFKEIGFGRDSEMAAVAPDVDIYEKDDKLFAEIEIPGIDKKNIDISIEDHVLSIKGEKKSEREDKGRNYHVVERRYGQFHRAFRIPEYIKAEEIKAKFDNGILTVEMPKKEEVKKSSIKVRVE